MENPKTHIIIKGARVHNLRNISVNIPKGKLVIITGLSGSGKSSLAFDTLYAEGQRRYVESLSSYARQFLGRLDKPDVDHIKGIAPAIAIEQKVISRNPRSTVGTVTEIYDYLKLLFARAGKTYSPETGEEVKRDTLQDVVNFIQQLEEGYRVYLLFSRNISAKASMKSTLESLMQQGYTRVFLNEEIVEIEDALKKKLAKTTTLEVVADRFLSGNSDNDTISRQTDSVEICMNEGNGKCIVRFEKGRKFQEKKFANLFEADGLTFEEPTPHFFAFNNPIGACKRCEGFGSIIGIDEDLVIPNRAFSIYDDAVACWRGETMSEWKNELIKKAHKFNFPVHKPIKDLTAAQYKLLWKGNDHFDGLDSFFQHLQDNLYKIQYRVMLSRYRGKTICPDCLGTRLRKDANYVKVGGKCITDLVLCEITECLEFFKALKLPAHEAAVAKRILPEITTRLTYMVDVGLGYLTLNRPANTLSGGESQRINLATSLGSSLVGSMYILDEPSIGLHPRDTNRLLGVLKNLRDLGNTVIVVEHEEEVIRAGDHIIDLGPMAGSHGGNVMFEGSVRELETSGKSLTADYLNGTKFIPSNDKPRKWTQYIEVKGARENNLKNVTVKFPMNVIAVVTGVSGSGKSSLVRNVLYPALTKQFGGYGDKQGKFDGLDGKYKSVEAVQFVDQNPIGKSSRSNPVTYVKAFDEIRTLFSQQDIARAKGYKPSHFSFNVSGGRCEECDGEGKVTIEMQFMADIELTCEECNGKRYKEEILEVQFQGKNIYDVLQMTIDDAIEFFKKHSATETDPESRVVRKLTPLKNVGLGYLALGQSSSTLSGGEAQRVKLGAILGEETASTPTLFIFDEPTTGLHFDDIHKLIYAFNALVEKGHSVLIIEHNPDVIKCADWVIDLGPEGGDKGGDILFEGIPADLPGCKKSYTGKFLAQKVHESN
ncbi:MAG: excinuclease ABC subunit UvrA [Flavobacteriales bacterium]